MEFVLEIARVVLYVVGILAFVGFNASYLVLLERKGSARFQLRHGPTEVGPFGLIQPVADAVKLLCKQILIPKNVDVILFFMAPILVLLPAILCMVTIPFGATIAARNFNLGLLMVFAFAAFNVFGILIGGWASHNKYANLAAARVVAQNIAYEITTLLIVVAVVMVTGTFNLQEIVAQQAGGFWRWNILRLDLNPLQPVAFLMYFICLLAETNRAPFDMVEAESELVAGAYTEYSGMTFGVFFMAEYTNIVLGCCVATVLFLGGWQCPFGLVPGPHWFLLKMYALCFTVIWVRWSFPRVQFYNLLNLSWKILIPVSLANIILTALMLKVF